MRIELAENQKEITLGQYQELSKLEQRKDLDAYEFSKRKVKIFTGLSYRQISGVKQTDLVDVLKQIDDALNTEAKFQPTFEMSGVKFGFIPNFDDIKAREYFDLSTYDTEVETLHKLMAILFRPIKQTSLGKYEIINYKGTKEWSDVMKRTPLNIVNGSLVFFSSLAKELQSYILKSTEEAQAKAQRNTIGRSGDGMQRLTNWLTGKRGDIASSKI